jgi:hypothetical protein
MQKDTIYFSKYNSRKLRKVQFRNALMVLASFLLFFAIPAQVIFMIQSEPYPFVTTDDYLQGSVAGASTTSSNQETYLPTTNILIDNNVFIIAVGGIICIISILLIGFIFWSERRSKVQ